MKIASFDPLEGRLPSRGALGTALAVGLLGIVAWLGWSRPVPEAGSGRPGIVVLQPSRPRLATPPVLADAAAKDLAARCPQQSLLLSWIDGPPTPACVQPARVVQDGGLRRYVFEPAGPSGWRLNLETAGGEVMAAQLTSPRGETYGCTELDCEHFVLGPRRPQGREIRVHDALLEGTPTSTADEPPWLRLRATVLVADDAADAPRACPGARLSMRDDQGAREPLCPDAGSGVERLAGGSLRYTYADVDGRELVVTLAADGRVDQVTLQGMRCDGAACGGVALSLPDPADALGAPAVEAVRTMRFSDTRLTAGLGRQQRAVTLSGSVALPS